MTHEDKNLLLKDLCARLPYGVKVNVIYSNENASSFRQRVCVEGDNELNTDIIGLYQRNEIDIRPYLFPLSSMTEEQKEELFFNYIHNDIYFDDFTDYFLAGELWHDICVSVDALPLLINWLNKNHFDIYGLIPKDLAIDSTWLNIY